MRYAIFSDIHGNLEAWHKVLEDIRELEADVLVCLGDVVGYGPKPDEVLSSIRAETDNFVMGNHDAAAVGVIDPSWFNPNARAVLEWTCGELSEDSLEFLRNVPLTMESENIYFVHAEIEEPGRFGYIVNEEDATRHFAGAEHFVTFVGHTHHPLVFDRSIDESVVGLGDSDCQLDPTHRYIINVGSVGEPRNPEDIRARYVIYDSDTREVFFRRIDFDYEAYRRDLLSTTLTVTPYFLQVVDHLADTEVEEVAAMTVDMAPQVNLEYLKNFQATQPQRLHVPTNVRQGRKPRPKPRPVQDTGSKTGLLVGLITLTLALAGVAYLYFERQMVKPPSQPVAEKLIPVEVVPKPETMVEVPTEPEPKLAPEPVQAKSKAYAANYVRVSFDHERALRVAELEVFNNGANIAPGSIAKMSSAIPGTRADFAIDGNRGDNNLASTARQNNAWLELDLGETMSLDELVIVHPGDTNTFLVTLMDEGRLPVWKATVTSDSGAVLKFDPAANQVTEDSPPINAPGFQVHFPPLLEGDQRPVGQFVRVYLPREGMISLREVQVFSDGHNLAAEGQASMSSVKVGSTPERAIDLKHGVNLNATSDREDKPWWEVNLGEEKTIDAVVVWNRTDDMKNRLKDFRVQILDANREQVTDDPGGKLEQQPLTVLPGKARITQMAEQKAKAEKGAVAWWRMEPNSAEMTLVDANGNFSLPALQPGKVMPPQAPNPIPATEDANTGALAGGNWGETQPSGNFHLSKERSFTFEGWFVTGAIQKPVVLAGTRTGPVNQNQGWHVDLRPKSNRYPNGQMGIYYDYGPKAIQAVSEDLRFADLKPHHFAAIWDHEEASLRLLVDSEEVARQSVPLSVIPPHQANPFKIGAAEAARFGLDELRFSPTALASDQLLNVYPLVAIEVQNGSFEQPQPVNPNLWIEFPDDGPWKASYSDRFQIAKAALKFVSTRPFGGQVCSMTDGATISQELGPAQSNTEYVLTFHLCSDLELAKPIDALKVRLIASGKSIISTRVTPPTEIDEFQKFSVSGNTDEKISGNLRIEFGAVGGSDQRTFIDNVELFQRGGGG